MMDVTAQVLDLLTEDSLSTSSSSWIETSSESSSFSEDEEILYRVKNMKMKNFIENVKTYNDEDFRNHFRIHRQMIPALVERVSHLFPQRNSSWPNVTAELGIHLLLWYLANNKTFTQIGGRCGVTISCAHGIVKKLTDYFTSVAHEFIYWPDLDQLNQSAELFRRRRGLTRVVGCIDGSHIPINKPKEHREDYLNREKYYSVLMQGVVDHDCRFINLYVGEPGSLNEATMLRRSNLFDNVTNNNLLHDFYLLGDSAYPSLSWLVPPFRDNGDLTENQNDFNKRHSATRIIVEHAFGVLKGRFRRLLHFNNKDLGLINQCIITACVLHNMCISEGDLGNDFEIVTDNVDEENFEQSGNQARETMFLELYPDN